MTDAELIARLRDFDKVTIGDARVAADRIEDLTAENAKLHDHIEGVAKDTHKVMVGYEAKLAECEARLRKAVEALDAIRLYSSCGDTRRKAIETLAEISSEAALNKGESHD